ncbi:hypothetical protein GCM10010869_42050 [Mesorhizobium tianshanense]|uniref:hypothetical protein n=1 Tax=Mesorhizobium tianshanense TaxID=39844 RepID=UPI0011A0CEA9|nr:hypothetical protein [Mesorhizobium tianshanense]GLS38610.1 hypothetical protein GCM10010869_42050 [Mesorhizobium tianshanense]
MDDFADKQEKWKDYFLPRAKGGDPDAQRAVGLEFSAGRYLPKDLDQSEFWLRKSSEKLGERSLFQWMKILVLARDRACTRCLPKKATGDWVPSTTCMDFIWLQKVGSTRQKQFARKE